MSTLYRDYRPQNFSEVLGQNHIKITLQNEILSAKLANAYLFCGPRAVGKTTLARIMAKALNCETRSGKNFEPCNKCASCLSIKNGSNLDVIEIDAASNTGVDNVRENIIASARIAPQTKYKVFIIDEVHMLSISAFNALLKIIEEPPQNVKFILCTTEIHKVPLTIISRCERFDFKRISVAEVVQKLNLIALSEKIEIESGVLESVARQANGYMRDAESLLGQILALGEKKISLAQAELIIPSYNTQEIINLLDFISKKDAAKAIKLLNDLVDSGLNVKNFTGEVITLLRKIIFNKINPALASSLGLDFGEALEAKVGLLTEQLSLAEWLVVAQEFLGVYNTNANLFITQLPLELALINICQIDKIGRPSSGSDTETLRNFTRPPLTNPGAGNLNPNPGKLSKPNLNISDSNTSVSTLAPANLAPKNSSASALNLSSEELCDRWSEFLIKIKKHNHSLSFVLQSCQAKEIINSQLSLVFKYKFHKDRLNDPQVKAIVEATLLEVFGQTLDINSQIDENLVIGAETGAQNSKSEISTSETPRSENSSSTKPAPASTPDQPAAATSELLGNLLSAFGGEVIN